MNSELVGRLGMVSLGLCLLCFLTLFVLVLINSDEFNLDISKNISNEDKEKMKLTVIILGFLFVLFFLLAFASGEFMRRNN